MWIRLILPPIMRLVDDIPLARRTLVTSLCLAFMLVDGAMTLLVLDCWSQREAGLPVETEVQQFFDEYYDDEFMETRFTTMGISEERAIRAQGL